MPVKSGGCGTCRARKVKCDQRTPSCQRCINANRICPGYRSNNELVFCDMNVIAEKKVKARLDSKLRVKENLTTPPIQYARTATQTNHAPVKEVLAIGESRVPPSIGQHWQQDAITAFFHDYVLKSTVLGFDLSFLQEMHFIGIGGHSFQGALDAVALLSLAKKSKADGLRVEADRAFSGSLQTFKQLLQDPEKARRTSTLATFFLLSLYETIDGTVFTCRSTEHHNDMISFLRVQGEDQFAIPISRSLFWFLVSHLISRSLIYHREPPPESERWLHLLKLDELSHKLALYDLHICHFCYKTQSVLDSNTYGNEKLLALHNLVREATLIDIDLDEWRILMPPEWLPRTVESQPSLSHDGVRDSPLPNHMFHDLYIGYHWNKYRSTRIHLHSTLLHITNLLHTSLPQPGSFLSSTSQNSQSIISRCIVDIRSSASFMLGRIDVYGNPCADPIRGRGLGAYFSCIPFQTAMMAAAEEGSEMEAWFEGQLEGMGVRCGEFSGGQRRTLKSIWHQKGA